MPERRYIKNQRQKRALITLLSTDSIAVSEIGPEIGALNPRQTIMELRKQGFLGIIETHRHTVFDRDGKRCHPGEYLIPTPLKPLAQRVLDEYNASCTNRKEVININQIHDNKELPNDSTK